MTVCIAAICDSGRSLVVCADRMFTNPGLSVEFETSERKIEEIGRACVMMAAGNSVNATEVLGKVMRKLGGNPNPTILDVAEICRQEYAVTRDKMAFENVIMPAIGPDFARFHDHGVPLPTYLEKQPGAFQQLTVLASQQSLGTDFLLAGLDDSGAHLFHVMNPGVYAQLDKLGYAATGSGGIHATIRLSLGGQARSRDLLSTLADVYNAKRAAEVAPGVGEATDIAIIDESGTFFCPKEIMDELKNIHEKSAIKPISDLNTLKMLYDEKRPKTA